MKKLLALLFLSVIGYAGFSQAPTSVYWLKSRVDGSVPTPISGWGSLYFDYVTSKWKICNGTSCYDLPVGMTTRNNLPPSVHTSSFTLSPADTSKMHILSGGSGAIVITMGTFSSLSGKGLQFAFRRDRVDTVYFATGSETIIQSPGATLGVADSTFAYLYYNGMTDKFYLANGGSGGSGGGSGTVESVTGPNVDNTDPANPVVNAQTTITGNAGTATALATSRTIGTMTGDATSAGSGFNGTANNTNVVTLATVNSNVGSFGSATLAPVLTVNGKGLVTAVSTATITVVSDGVTITGDGTAGAPLVSSGMQGSNNLSEATNITTARSNIGASADKVTTTTKTTGFTPALSDFTGIQPLYRCTASFTITLPSDATQAIPQGKIFYGITTAGNTTTFAPGSGVTPFTSSGGYTVTPGGAADFVFWSATKTAADTWSVQIGSPPATSPFGITFLANVQTFTNMPAGVQEITLGTTNRYRSKADLTNYQQVRVTVGVSTAGSTNAGFYLQYSTDDSSFTDIGTASGSDIAVIGTTGTKVSGWVNLPTGAKADVFLRCVAISGDGAADPVVGLITAQFR